MTSQDSPAASRAASAAQSVVHPPLAHNPVSIAVATALTTATATLTGCAVVPKEPEEKAVITPAIAQTGVSIIWESVDRRYHEEMVTEFTDTYQDALDAIDAQFLSRVIAKDATIPTNSNTPAITIDWDDSDNNHSHGLIKTAWENIRNDREIKNTSVTLVTIPSVQTRVEQALEVVRKQTNNPNRTFDAKNVDNRNMLKDLIERLYSLAYHDLQDIYHYLKQIDPNLLQVRVHSNANRTVEAWLHEIQVAAARRLCELYSLEASPVPDDFKAPGFHKDGDVFSCTFRFKL